MILEIIEKRKANNNLELQQLISFNIFLNIIIICVYALSIIMQLIYLVRPAKTFFAKERYVDSYTTAVYYNYVYYVECVLCSLVFIKILNFLQLNDYVRLFYESISLGNKIMLKYFFFVFLILLGFSSISLILWGQFLQKYRTILDAFLNILLFTTGNK